jgi:hypothetical protein
MGTVLNNIMHERETTRSLRLSTEVERRRGDGIWMVLVDYYFA